MLPSNPLRVQLRRNPGVQATPISVVLLCGRFPGAPDPDRCLPRKRRAV